MTGTHQIAMSTRDIKHLYAIALATHTSCCFSFYITASEQWSLNTTDLKALDNFAVMNNIIINLGCLPGIYN